VSTVISAWSAISPWGLDAAAFTDGLRTRRPTAAHLDPEQWDVPVEEACLVPGFDVREVLGRKGTRSMDRATGLAVAVLGDLLTGGADGRLRDVDERAGLTLGTNTGSAQSMMDFTRDSLVGERSYLVDPARFPNTVMNCAAGHSAIWHRLKGPNTTVSGGRATGLLALRHALRLLGAGRAPAMLCGAVEEFSRARAWLEWHAASGDGHHPLLGEGAAAWLLESGEAARHAGRTPVLEVAAIEFGFSSTGKEVRPVLADCLRRVFDRGGIKPGDLAAVAAARTPGPDGDAERDALDTVLDGHRPAELACGELIGDTFAASATFQVAALLAGADGLRDEPGGHVLATSAETNGVAGAALFRLPHRRNTDRTEGRTR
jgi:3-oxoacyl-[acyl-carrier-protein] synthase II